MEEQTEVRKKKSGGGIVTIVLIVLALLAGAGATAYALKVKPELIGLGKSQAQAQNEAEKVLSEVGKLIALPNDEKPTIATVSDVEKLKGQQFFKNAANGDKVLIYTNSRKAILYRPNDKRIIEVGAVNINQQPSTEQTATSTPSPRATEAPTE